MLFMSMRSAAKTACLFIVLFAISSIAAVTSFHSSSKAASLASLAGLWRTHDGGLVRFYNCGSQVCGRLIKAKTTLRHDTNNPNPKMRKRPIKGLTIIKSRKKTGPQKWVGTVYNINDGKTYQGSLKLVGHKKAELTGCMSAGFCKSALWKKIRD